MGILDRFRRADPSPRGSSLPSVKCTLTLDTSMHNTFKVCKFSPVGNVIATAGDVVTILDLTTRQFQSVIRPQEGELLTVAFAPDGASLAIGNVNGQVTLHNPHTGTSDRLHSEPSLSRVAVIVFSPDGNLLACSAGGPYTKQGKNVDESKIQIWHLQDTQKNRLWDNGGPGVGIPGLAFAKDGHILAAARTDSIIDIWSITENRIIRQLTAEGRDPTRPLQNRALGGLHSLAFSPDGAQLMVASRENILLLWDLQSDFNRRTIELKHPHISSCAYSRDGKFIAVAGESASKDSYLLLMDLETEQTSETYFGKNEFYPPYFVEVSPDGKSLVTGGYLWRDLMGPTVSPLRLWTLS